MQTRLSTFGCLWFLLMGSHEILCEMCEWRQQQMHRYDLASRLQVVESGKQMLKPGRTSL